MTLFRNMKLGTMLGIGFAIVIGLSFMVAAYGRFQLDSTGKTLHALSKERMDILLQLQQVKDNTNVVARAVRNLALLEDEAAMAEEKKRLDGVVSDTSQIMAALQQRVVSAEGRALMGRIAEARPQFLGTVDKAAKLGLANDLANARTVVLGEMRTAQNVYFKAVEDMISLPAQGDHGHGGIVQQRCHRRRQHHDRAGSAVGCDRRARRLVDHAPREGPARRRTRLRSTDRPGSRPRQPRRPRRPAPRRLLLRPRRHGRHARQPR